MRFFYFAKRKFKYWSCCTFRQNIILESVYIIHKIHDIFWGAGGGAEKFKKKVFSIRDTPLCTSVKIQVNIHIKDQI